MSLTIIGLVLAWCGVALFTWCLCRAAKDPMHPKEWL